MKEKAQNKLVVPLLALAIVGVVGSAYTLSNTQPTTAHAQSTAQAQTTAAVDKPESGSDKQDTAGEQKPTYTSSIRVPENKQEMDDATEVKQLASLAKITSDQAKAAAEKSAGGTSTSVKLEEDNGNVVYAVTIGSNEVKVDAGNGTILHTETAEAKDSGERGGEAN